MILNRQHRVPIAVGALEKFFARARRTLRLRADAVTVCFVTDAEIARWNRAYRGKEGPTDVLSFPIDGTHGNGAARNAPAFPSSSNPSHYLGDIAIAPGVARRNARRFGRSFDDEMCVLILHGMLHLMGYDHESDRGQMERREQRLRRALGFA